MLASKQIAHEKVIRSFIRALNDSSDRYILKGGTALMLCYGLNRFSEDIDLDSTDRKTIRTVVDKFCKESGYSFRIGKDTPTTLRFLIHYDDSKPLKVEVSYRTKRLSRDITVINGILVYGINKLCDMKRGAYQSRDRIRDLFDLSFIVNKYFNELDYELLLNVAEAISYKGDLKQFDYLVATQHDEFIDDDALAESFMNAIDKLGLLTDRDTGENEHEKSCINHPFADK